MIFLITMELVELYGTMKKCALEGISDISNEMAYPIIFLPPLTLINVKFQ